jgi:large conductance mechanosensitive channel
MGFLKDFKAFAFKGNVLDLAVAVIIGGAFGKIITALVDDIIMPIIGKLTPGGQKFTDLFYVLTPGKTAVDYKSLADAKGDGANVLAYGAFIQTIVDFLIIAFFIFLAIQAMSRMQRQKDEEAAAPAGPSSTDQLLMEIRDELKKQPPAR